MADLPRTIQVIKQIFAEDYHGFESLFDLQRDIIEALDPAYNEAAEDIPNEFQGTIKVVITYEEK